MSIISYWLDENADKANRLTKEFYQTYNKVADLILLDIYNDDLVKLLAPYKVDLIVDASGCFKFGTNPSQANKVAQASLELGCHYIDLADNRAYVQSISTFDQKAKAKGLSIISGASTVPGLTSAVIEKFSKEFSVVETIDFGISPGNKTERGEATVASILNYVGKGFNALRQGKVRTIYGWQDLRLYNFGSPLGRRWMSNCDIPDLDLLPLHYPSLKTVRFQAGLEVSILHLGLWVLSGFSRIGWIKNWSRFSTTLTRLSCWFDRLGSNKGGMYVEISGKDSNEQTHHVNWQLVAEAGVGPNIPTIAAEILIEKIAKGEFTPGARPCVNLFSLDEFFAIAKRWNIYQRRVS